MNSLLAGMLMTLFTVAQGIAGDHPENLSRAPAPQTLLACADRNNAPKAQAAIAVTDDDGRIILIRNCRDLTALLAAANGVPAGAKKHRGLVRLAARQARRTPHRAVVAGKGAGHATKKVAGGTFHATKATAGFAGHALKTTAKAATWVVW